MLYVFEAYSQNRVTDLVVVDPSNTPNRQNDLEQLQRAVAGVEAALAQEDDQLVATDAEL